MGIQVGELNCGMYHKDYISPFLPSSVFNTFIILMVTHTETENYSNKKTILKDWIIPKSTLGIYGTREFIFRKNTKAEP